MLRNRLITAFIIVLVGLGSILVLPKSFGLKDAAVFDAFPTNVGEWQGQFREAGDREKKVLDAATDFRKRFYFRKSPTHLGQFETIDATSVLSGDDMNNSIHRPERCLKAQGFEKITPTTVTIEVGEKKLKVKRLTFVQRLKDGTEFQGVMYYWFVGADHLTCSHYERTLYDIQHRLLKGTNQRWAYISLQSQYGEAASRNNPQIAANTEAETDAYIQEFIRNTFFQIHKTDEIKGWKSVAKSG